MIRVSQRLTATLALWFLIAPMSACEDATETDLVADVLEHSTNALNGRVAQITVLSRDGLVSLPMAITVSGQFAEFYGVDEDTVRRSLDLWSPLANQPVETCEIRDEAYTRVDDWYASRIDLLHAGPLLVTTEADELVLEPRLLPGMLPYLGGYTYGTDRDTTLSLETDEEISIWSEGGYDIEGFDVRLELPDPIVISHINAVAVDSADAIRAPGEILDIRWDGGVEHDVVYLSVRPDDPGDPLELACVFFDDGELTLDEDLLHEFRDHTGSTALRLHLRRARLESIELDSFDSAEAIAISEHSVVLY